MAAMVSGYYWKCWSSVIFTMSTRWHHYIAEPCNLLDTWDFTRLLNTSLPGLTSSVKGYWLAGFFREGLPIHWKEDEDVVNLVLCLHLCSFSPVGPVLIFFFKYLWGQVETIELHKVQTAPRLPLHAHALLSHQESWVRFFHVSQLASVRWFCCDCSTDNLSI